MKHKSTQSLTKQWLKSTDIPEVIGCCHLEIHKPRQVTRQQTNIYSSKFTAIA